MSEIFKVKEFEPSGGDGRLRARLDRSFKFQRNTLRSSLLSFISPRIININIFGLQSVQGHEWACTHARVRDSSRQPHEEAAPREMTVNSKERRWGCRDGGGGGGEKHSGFFPQNICQ